MRNNLALMLIVVSLLVGCNDNSNPKQEIHIGYVTEFSEGKILIIGSEPDLEHQMLKATSIPYKELEIGTRVKYVYDGVMEQSYPGRYGIKIVEVVDKMFINSKSDEREIISIVINDLKEKKEISYTCINNIKLDDGIWAIRAIEDDFNELSYYDFYIYDDTKKIKEIIAIQVK